MPATLVILIAVPQLLLWRFLGFGAATLIPGAVAVAALGLATTRALAPVAIPLPRLAILGSLALALCLLGGEGRFFYANPDWQVRDAVLRDFAAYPWPWAYAGATPLMLRVPAGVYLLPALVGKAGGYHAAELAMLAQNAALLGIVLALGSTLFDTSRTRRIAGIVIVGFSGMDAIGMLLTGQRLTGHLEWWTATQYSSHLTQIFWVPQHALAGWIGTLLYLLWRQERIALTGLLAPLPLLALWSPLALIGMLPFAAQAGIATIARRGLRIGDVAWPALASIIALPGLLYLAAGSSAVGGRPMPLSVAAWASFVALEVGPYLLALGMVARNARCGGVTLALVAALLLGAPLVQVGDAADFAMRASIPALAILAVQVADLLAARGGGGEARGWRIAVTAALAIGAATPLAELRRALTYPAAPAPLCSYLGVVPGGAPTYVAPLAGVSSLIRPAAPALIVPHDPPRCWVRAWPFP